MFKNLREGKMKIKKSIELSVLAAATLLASTASHAFAIDTINTTVSGGAFDGTVGQATLIYNGASITGVGIETVSTFSGNTHFDIFGETYDLIDGLNSPVLSFNNGTAVSFDFTIFDNNPTDILEPGVDAIIFSGGIDLVQAASKGSIYTGTLTISSVPLPASAWLFASGLIGLVGMQRRKS